VPRDAFPVEVVRVVDGDTLVAVRPGSTRQLKVRMLGVDSPESVKPGTAVACFGHQASAFLRRLLPRGHRVLAAYEVEREDSYHRQLWDLWLPDGTYVEAVLGASGLVRPDPFPPNVTYAAAIALAVRTAHDRRRGLWGSCALTAAFPQLAKRGQ
jgi:micrococcal nuclease